MALSIKGSAFYFGDQVEAPEASFGNFFQWLKEEATPGRKWPFIETKKKDDGHHRQLFIDYNDSYWCGVFVSAKPNEYQHYVTTVDGKVVVEARSVGGNPPVEVNFFCIRRDTCKAIFSHYIASYRFHSFIGDLWAHYRYFVEAQKTKALQLVEGAETKEKESKEKSKKHREIIKRYSLKGKCNSSPLFDQKSFNEMVDKLHKLQTVRLTTYETDSPEDRPVSSRVKTVHKTYRFSTVEQVDSGVRKWLRDVRISTATKTKAGKDHYSGSIIGSDNQGDDVFISFGQSMKNYLKYDYDRLGTFTVDDILTHDIIKEMIAKMKTGILFNAVKQS